MQVSDNYNENDINIIIRTVSKMRYPEGVVTSGDWYRIGETEVIDVERIGRKYGFLIALHELVEMELCRHAGVTQEMVDEFDFGFKGEDPGSDLKAPYHRQHFVATIVERIVAEALGFDWEVYCQETGLKNILVEKEGL